MEFLEESMSNQEKVNDKNDDNKIEDNSLKENGAQEETLPKKKFAKTNFALKMKNKKKEEKLNSLDTKETLSSCKEVSIDVTRLNSNPVPKLIAAVDNKMRKKKRSQWKMGIMKKKKKSLGKDLKINPLSKQLINGENNHVGEDINAIETVKIKKEEPIQPKSEKKNQPTATDGGESSQRRKSLRSTTSSISETNVCEFENKIEIKPEEEIFSCRRTEPFIGKLLTKEARAEIANRISKVESNSETSEKDVQLESKESKAEDVNKSLPESSKTIEASDKIDKKAEKSLKPTVMESDKKVMNKPSRRSTPSVMDSDEKVMNKPSRRSTQSSDIDEKVINKPSRSTQSVMDTDEKVIIKSSTRSIHSVMDTVETMISKSSRRSTQSVTNTDETVLSKSSRRSTKSMTDIDEKVVNKSSRRSIQSVMDTDEKVVNKSSRRSIQSVTDTDEKVVNKSSRRSVQSVTDTDEKVVNKSSRRSIQSVTDTDEKVVNKSSRRSIQSVMDTDEKVLDQPLRRSASKIIEAKESFKIEETSCSRTMPFVGKGNRKSAAAAAADDVVPQRPIELDSSTNQSDDKFFPKDNTNNLESTAADEKTELFNSPKDINSNADSTLGIKILSVSSLKDDDSMKADFQPEKIDEPVNEPVVIPLKNPNLESDSSNKTKMDSDASVNKTEVKSSKSIKLDTATKSIKEQTDILPEKIDTIKETRRSTSSVKRRSSLRCNVNVKSDSLSEEFDSKSSTSTLDDVQDPWSCQRVVPFRGNNKSLTNEEASNQTKTPSAAPEISSVLSDDLTAPPVEPTSERLVSEQVNQLAENKSQNEIKNDAPSKDCDQVQPAAEPLDNTDGRSSTASPVLNGEWKFRRKRLILSSDDECQDKKRKKTKKAQVQSPSVTKTDRKTVNPLLSPGKTICSFLSTKCAKHDHHSQSDPCPVLDDVKPAAYVLLTRLEDMQDAEVQGYFAKTDLANRIKKNYHRIMVNKEASDTSKIKPDRERSISTSTQATKDDLIPSNVPETAQESDSNSSFRPSQETEDTSSQSTSSSISRRRIASRVSSESPVLHAKRKKRPVNYLEEFSDSDDDHESSFRKLRSQSRGLTFHDRNRSGVQSTLDEDEDMENDMEVEEFSRVGHQNRTEDSNQESSEQDANCSRTEGIQAVGGFKKAQARCKSVAERKMPDAPKYPTRSKTPHIGILMEKEKPIRVLNASEIDKKKLEEDLVQGLKSMEETINKEMEKRGLIPPGSSKSTNRKTPSLSHHISSEQLSSMSSVSANKSITPKKIFNTPQHDIVSPTSGMGSTPRRSVTFQKNELLSKVTRSASELLEADRKKEMKIKDVLVQLVKLEAVCSDYKDYSASDIELLTSKYIDMLMNSNFACDTWRVNPIKLATASYTRAVDLPGDDEGDSDPESQDNEPLPFEEVQVPMDSVDVNVEQSPRRKSPKKSNKQSAESPCATVSQETSLHEKTFGAINISEVLSQPAAAEEDAGNIRPIDSNAEDEANENDDSIVKDSDAILVNGTEVHACIHCNKIFMEKGLLDKHFNENHTAAKSSAATVTVSSKFNERQAPGPASSKKIKKKLKNNNDSLKCTICSESYETKELLFDHIMTHNEQDLQQAYKAAKLAKAQQRGETEDSEPMAEELEKSKKYKKKSCHRKSTDSSSTVVSGEELAIDDARAATSLVDAISQQASSSVISVTTASQPSGTSSNKALTACQCHAHELTTQDLHIEMVLLCTACNVIYRRRDCFEVHFRTSPECRRERANGKVTKSPKLFCSGCRCILNSLMEMRSHLEEHAQKNCTGTVTFLCNICKVAFFGVGGIFYSHWFNHAKSPNFVASRYSFPKLSVVSVLEDVNGTMTTSKSQEGFFYIAEHVCRECRLPFSSDPELQKHKPCQPPPPLVVPRVEPPDNSRLQMIKLICDLCKKYYVSKDQFDKHCNDRNHLKTPITKFSRLPVSDKEQVFVCSLCRGLSKTLDEMKEHWKRVHSPIMELYTCKTCNVMPSNDVANYTYDKFEHHCRLVHKSEVTTCLVYFVTARYVCNICKFGFETAKSMKEHELVHQKKVATQTLPVQNAPTALPLPVAQTATFFVADNPQQDGGRLLHPVVLQYPNMNGTIAGPMTMSQLPNCQPQMQLSSNQPTGASSFIATTSNPIVLPTTNVVRMPNATVINQDNNNPELRSLLQNALQGPAQHSSTTLPHGQQQKQSNTEKVVEMIELDSRSNSPVLDSPAAASTSSSSNSLAVAKKAYMTKVNPNFETILQTTTGDQENRDSTNTPNSDKGRPNRDENATPAEVDTLTPQPFEVVLVTDELSENSDQDKNDKLGSAVSDEQPPPPPQEQAPEIIETKSFLRVRSVAELQSIKIHLCSICGLSFDTPYAFEQHEKQHRAMGELGRSTPVQMISPMVAPPNKESTNDPHSMLMTQMKQKLTMNMSNGSNSPNASSSSTNSSTRAMPMPNVLPHQPVLPPQQQQSWYPTTSNTTSSISNMQYATNQSVQPPSSQQQSILRQGINTGTLSKTGYTTVRPPPPYPSTSNSMVASNRPSAIQLPDRSMTHNIPPQTKRPSGAATRIPQQSLQNYEDINNRQTVSSVWGYSSGGSVTYNTAPQQPFPMQKTYGPAPNTVNYSTVNSTVNYQSVPQSQPRQPVPQKNIIYTCKHPNCFYRSASLAGIRAHETIHLLPQQGQQSQQHPTTSNNNQQQQQQQQQPPRLLPVSQMPERTRHAVPTSRPPGVSSDKRITCRICNLNCATSIELIEHVSTVHSGANQVCCYVCDYCPSPLIFDTEDQLRKHMNVRHNHSCELCNKRYPSKEDLMLHMEVHMRRA